MIMINYIQNIYFRIFIFFSSSASQITKFSKDMKNALDFNGNNYNLFFELLSII